MPIKVFKMTPPPEIIWDLLEEICFKEKDFYIVNYESYKKMFYLEMEDYLFYNLLEYYNEVHYPYIENDLNYRGFLTVIRQVCKENSVPCIYDCINESGYFKQFYRVACPP